MPYSKNISDFEKWIDGMFNAIGATNNTAKNYTVTVKQQDLNTTPSFEIQSVLSNRKKNAFTVVWTDGTHTTVHCQPGDEWDDEKALAMCFTKKALGNKGNFNDKFNDALDNKMKVIPGGAGIVAKHECKCDTPCEDCLRHNRGTHKCGIPQMGTAAEKANVAMKKLIDELSGKPVKVQRYNLLLEGPDSTEKEICYNCTDEEIHKAMRAYRMKYYPALEADRTPYRVWQSEGSLIVDFGASSYFKVPGMDPNTFIKGK